METPISDWVPSSFVEASEVGEVDSLSSFQSVTTPGSMAVDPHSEEASVDTTSRQKSNLADNELKSQPVSPKNETSTIAFEEDTRSAWSVEPPPQPSTEFQDTDFKGMQDIDFKGVQDTDFKEQQGTDFKAPQDVDFENPKDTNFKEPQITVSKDSQSSNFNDSQVSNFKDLQDNFRDTQNDNFDDPPISNFKDLQDNFRDPQVGSFKDIKDNFIDPQNDNFDDPQVSNYKDLQNNFSDPQVDNFNEPQVNNFNNIQDDFKNSQDNNFDDPQVSNFKGLQDINFRDPQDSNFKDTQNIDSKDTQDSEFQCLQNTDLKQLDDLTLKSSQSSELKCSPDPNSTDQDPKSTDPLNCEFDVLPGSDYKNVNPDEKISVAVDDLSQNSESSQKSLQKHKDSFGEESKLPSFPPENLLEYMWPENNGEYFLLQEQVSDYLNIKSFKRKYPDLFRRAVDADEKQYLKSCGAVSEMQCDLGLTALRSEEVLELMSKDYPEQFKEFIHVLREKQQQSISEKHREYVASTSDKQKMADMVKRAVQSAAEYNAHLNQERRDERQSCMDLQTYTIHYPAKLGKPKIDSKPGKYPVALLPGQYQDYYKNYTSTELKYFPLNTVLYGPLRDIGGNGKISSDGSPSDSEESTASEGSCCSSSQETHDDSSSCSDKVDVASSNVSVSNPKVKLNAICKVCKKGSDRNGSFEELVHCADCDNSAHPSCIELAAEAATVLKNYPWQCMDCKKCSHCCDPGDEDKMLFCDICDRGYHTFCVGLKAPPVGKWVCRRCGCCSMCGSSHPGSESSKAQWQYELPKGGEVDVSRRPKILCQLCFKKKR